jgi:hypothetical protein
MPRPRRNHDDPNALPPVTVGEGPDLEDEFEQDGPATYVVHSKQLDRFNTVRTRVKVTPAVCDICGIDFVALNRARLGAANGGVEPMDFDSLTPRQREDMAALVAEHKRLHHTSADKHIVTEAELPKEWLGRR